MTSSPNFHSPVLHRLEVALRAQGFERFVPPTQGDRAHQVLWQRAMAGVEPVCRYNGGLRLNVTLYEFRRPPPAIDHIAAEVELHAQLPDEQWARMTLTPETVAELMAQLPVMQTKLVTAWQALAALSRPEDLDRYVIRYADGAYNQGSGPRNGFAVRLAEATRYPTRELALEMCRDLPDDVSILTLRQAMTTGSALA